MQQANRSAQLENYIEIATREVKSLKSKVSIEGYAE